VTFFCHLFYTEVLGCFQWPGSPSIRCVAIFNRAFLYCQGVWHGIMLCPDRLESLLLHGGVFGILPRRLRSRGTRTPLSEIQ